METGGRWLPSGEAEHEDKGNPGRELPVFAQGFKGSALYSGRVNLHPQRLLAVRRKRTEVVTRAVPSSLIFRFWERQRFFIS